MSEARPFTHLAGTSAGGIEALSALVPALPENFPAPIVVTQHLDPESKLPLERGVVFAESAPQDFAPRNEGGEALPPEEQPQTRAVRGETTSGGAATGRSNGDRGDGIVDTREVGR